MDVKHWIKDRNRDCGDNNGGKAEAEDDAGFFAGTFFLLRWSPGVSLRFISWFLFT